MRILILTISSISILLFSIPQAFANNYSVRICEYVAVNDKNRLRSFLKTKKLKIRSIHDSILCNGKNLLIFAASSNALDTGELIIGKLPKSTVAENLDEIEKYSAHLAAIAKNRIK